MISKNQFSARGILLFSLFVFLMASAFTLQTGDDILDRILRIIASFATLGGIAALVAVLIAFFRWANLIKSDLQAAQITALLNLIAFVALVVLGIFRPDLSLDFLNGIALKLAAIALFVLGFLTQILLPAKIWRALYNARIPFLYSMGIIAGALPLEDREPPRNWTIPPQ